MSGGVDSSAAAMLLQQQGYDVTGATLRMFSNEDLGLEQDSTCCSLSDVEDAKLVAHKLGIPHYVFNFSPCFRRCVIDRFISEYEAGRTPNPCVDCNKHIKFGELLDRARLMDCEYLATGHYARIIFDADRNRWLLARGDDHAKDQSYMLFNLTQQQLAHILLPLADITKPEIRRMSENRGLVTAHKPDSQDICFVPDGDYAKFIEKYTGKKTPEGDFVDKEGRGYGAAFNLKAEASDILIPVSDLVPTKAAMLPQDWPGVNPYWYPASAQENNGIALDWKIIEFVQVSLREELYNIGNQKNKGVVVERIDLLFQ